MNESLKQYWIQKYNEYQINYLSLTKNPMSYQEFQKITSQPISVLIDVKQNY